MPVTTFSGSDRSGRLETTQLISGASLGSQVLRRAPSSVASPNSIFNDGKRRLGNFTIASERYTGRMRSARIPRFSKAAVMAPVPAPNSTTYPFGDRGRKLAMRRPRKRELGTADPMGPGLLSNSPPKVKNDVTASNATDFRGRPATLLTRAPEILPAYSADTAPLLWADMLILSLISLKKTIIFFSRFHEASRRQILSYLPLDCKPLGKPILIVHAVRLRSTDARLKSISLAAGGLHQPALSPHHPRNRRRRALHHRPRELPFLVGEKPQGATTHRNPSSGPPVVRPALRLGTRGNARRGRAAGIARRKLGGHQHGLSGSQDLPHGRRLEADERSREGRATCQSDGERGEDPRHLQNAAGLGR